MSEPTTPDPVHEENGRYFFYDETWADRNGPYPTRKIAEQQCLVYADSLSNRVSPGAVIRMIGVVWRVIESNIFGVKVIPFPSYSLDRAVWLSPRSADISMLAPHEFEGLALLKFIEETEEYVNQGRYNYPVG